MDAPNGETPIELPGLKIAFRVEDPVYEVADAEVGPGFAPTPHVHWRHHEVFLVVRGPIDFLIGDETVRAESGDMVDAPPGVVHDFCNPGPHVARLVCLATPGGLRDYFLEVGRLVRTGQLDTAALANLRTNYDAESVNVVWRVSSTAT